MALGATNTVTNTSPPPRLFCFSIQMHILPFRAGTQRISQKVELNHDEFTSAAAIEFFDINGNSVMAGCAKAIGRRFE
jgi:hypothetical protein